MSFYLNSKVILVGTLLCLMTNIGYGQALTISSSQTNSNTGEETWTSITIENGAEYIYDGSATGKLISEGVLKVQGGGTIFEIVSGTVEAKNLQVTSTTTLIVRDGATLTVTSGGGANLYGNITIEGSIVANSDVNIYGTLAVSATGNVTLNGSNNSTTGVNGNITVDAGGEVLVNGNFTNEKTIDNDGDFTITGALDNTSGTITGTNDVIAGSCTGDCGAVTLPVELLYFKASSRKNGQKLEWSTSMEINNDFFELQRSLDGQDFRSIGKIKGHGNSNSVLYYSFTDYTILEQQQLYYRLVQYDFDGTINIHKVVSVSTISNAPLEKKLSLFPTVLTLGENILIDQHQQDKQGIISVSICDTNGNIIRKKMLSNTEISRSFTHINTYGLSKGLFIILVHTVSGIESFKVLIK